MLTSSPTLPSPLSPTRRSSDLNCGSAPTRAPARWCRCACTGNSPTTQTAWCCRSCRSEEHTSELQSRRDLVCRLLLEKKKDDNQLADLSLLARFRGRAVHRRLV